MTTILRCVVNDMLHAQQQIQRLLAMDRSCRAQSGRGFNANEIQGALDVQQQELHRCGNVLAELSAANEGRVPLGRA